MFPVDALPAAYIEEREAEIRAARKADMERAARAFAQSGGQAPTSACTTPSATPHTGFGFFSGFFSAFARTPESSPTVMSRSSSSSGATCNSAPTSNGRN